MLQHEKIKPQKLEHKRLALTHQHLFVWFLFLFVLVSSKISLNFIASFPHSFESQLWITAVKCHLNAVKPNL